MRPVTRRRTPRLLAAVLVIALAAAAPYGLTLGNKFALDDRAEILNHVLVRSLANLGAIFASQGRDGAGAPNGLYRPLTTLSFALDYALAGPNPWWFHLVNVLLHLGVSLLAFAVIRDWLDDDRAAFGSALLFAVLPVHVEAVANVAGRKELLAAAFCLGTIFSYRRAQASGGWRLALPPLTFAAGLLSKEIAVAALGVIVFEDLVLRRNSAFGAARQRTLTLYGALTLTLAGYLAARWAVVGGFAPPAIPVLDNPAAHAATSTRLLTAIAVLGLGLRLQVAPFDLSPDYSLNAIPLATSPFDLRVLAALAILAALGAVLWLLRGQRGLLVAAALYVLALAPAANLFFAIGTVFGERLLYLPSVGFCALLGFAWARAAEARGRTAGAVLALVAVLGAAASARYAAAWHDDASLFAAAVRSRPQSAKVRYNYAVALRDRGDLPGALQQYDAAIDIHPTYEIAWSNRGAVRWELGDRAGAYADLTRAIELDPRDVYALVNRGLLLNLSGAPSRALADLDAALAIQPANGEALLNRALAHRALGNRAAARADALAALQCSPRDWRYRAQAQGLL